MKNKFEMKAARFQLSLFGRSTMTRGTVPIDVVRELQGAGFATAGAQTDWLQKGPRHIFLS